MQNSTDPARGGLIALFVDRPVLTLMATLTLALIGVMSFARLPLNLAPDGMTSDTINMWVPVRQAMTPTEVEDQVARPLEELLRTIPGIQHVRSTSSSGNARFHIELDNCVDPVLAAAEIRDRAQRARLQWPNGVDRYFTWREDAGSAPLAFFQLLAPGRDAEWDYLIDQVVRPRLEAVDGVGRAEMWGLLDETLRIYFDRDKLVEHRIDYGRLLRALAQDNFTAPVGELDDGDSRYLVRIDSKFRREAEIASYPIRPGLTIGDIARIERVPSVRDRLARFDQKYTYTGIIRAASGTNPVDTSNRVRAALDELRRDPRLEGLEFRFLFDQGEMIEESLSTLLKTSVQGGALALLVLFLFLRTVRATVAIALAIPLALLICGGYLFFTGQTLNILTMAGMTLAVGMVVDNSVVVLENIRRHRDHGMAPRDASVRGAREVLLAISLATLTTVVVIAPLMFMSSDSNLRVALSSLGMPLSVALIGSLFVALLLLPAGLRHLSTGRRRSPAARDELPPRWSPLRWLYAFNHGLLAVSLGSFRKRAVATVAAVLVLGSMYVPMALLDMRGDDGGPFQGGDVQMNLEMPRGFDLQAVDDLVRGYEDFLLARRDEWRIDHVSVRYDRRSARFDLTLDDSLDRAAITRLAREVRDAWPRRAGVAVKLRDRGGGNQGGAPGAEERDDRNFVLRIWGPDSEFLAAKALEVRDRLAQLESVARVEVGEAEDNQEVVVRVDRDRMSDLRVAPDSLVQTMFSGLRGQELTEYEELGREVHLIAQFDSDRNPTLLDLRETKVYSGAGTFQRIDDLTAIEFERALGSIVRLDGKTYVTVVGERTKGVTTGDFSSQLRSIMATTTLPHGYSWSEASRSREIREQLEELFRAGLLGFFLSLVVMAVLFESVVLPFAIVMTAPFALFGAFWSLFLFHGSMDVMAGIGMLLLCGVVVNNGIVLLDCIERLRHEGMSRNEAILEGTRIRLRPIVMTAFTTIVGLLPMALFGESTGQGLSYVGMAVAVAGGLFFATMFTAFAVPLAYTFFDDLANWLRGLGPLIAAPRATAATPAADSP